MGSSPYNHFAGLQELTRRLSAGRNGKRHKRTVPGCIRGQVVFGEMRIVMNKKTLAIVMLILALTAALAGCGGARSASAGQSSGTEEAYTHLEAEEAASVIESGDCVLIDVRSEEEFAVEHIPGAVNIPHDSDDESFTSAVPDKDKPIVLYCDYGGVSKDTAEHLSRDLGYTNVSEFDGLLVWEGDTVSGK